MKGAAGEAGWWEKNTPAAQNHGSAQSSQNEHCPFAHSTTAAVPPALVTETLPVFFDAIRSRTPVMPSPIAPSTERDALDEDAVWSLTAVDGHSLANLLRYARKEIYARYYAAFDPKSEREFADHFNAYDWYEAKEPDLTMLMTEAEKSNIRLLREIQSLIEK